MVGTDKSKIRFVEPDFIPKKAHRPQKACRSVQAWSAGCGVRGPGHQQGDTDREQDSPQRVLLTSKGRCCVQTP